MRAWKYFIKNVAAAMKGVKSYKHWLSFQRCHSTACISTSFLTFIQLAIKLFAPSIYAYINTGTVEVAFYRGCTPERPPIVILTLLIEFNTSALLQKWHILYTLCDTPQARRKHLKRGLAGGGSCKLRK